jgi:site-specific DNA-cytosine methylase
MYTLNATGVHGVAVGAFGGEVADTVTAKFSKGAELLQQGAQNGGNCVLQPVAFNFAPGAGEFKDDISRGLDPSCNQGGLGLVQSMAVRRLTPVECERLQGFPDNHTNIPWRKKPESPDGPRYKALGNSMAVPVMQWIGKRIQMVEDL